MAQEAIPLKTDLFPNTFAAPFNVTSPSTNDYDCIAWAYEDPSCWYWPDADFDQFWPDHIPREATLNAFHLLFEDKGFQACSDGSLEDHFQKIAIYTDKNNAPTHAARQLRDGNWTSKLGRWYDVSHTIGNMDSGSYGSVATFMKRQIEK